MQHAATDLLRRLHPDNFAAFAELFTAAVLQVRWGSVAVQSSCVLRRCFRWELQ